MPEDSIESNEEFNEDLEQPLGINRGHAWKLTETYPDIFKELIPDIHAAAPTVKQWIEVSKTHTEVLPLVIDILGQELGQSPLRAHVGEYEQNAAALKLKEEGITRKTRRGEKPSAADAISKSVLEQTPEECRQKAIEHLSIAIQLLPDFTKKAQAVNLFLRHVHDEREQLRMQHNQQLAVGERVMERTARSLQSLLSREAELQDKLAVLQES